jgi:hypothetical protein
MAAGLIFSLDLGARCGFAIGAPGTMPDSGTVILKKPDEPRAIAFSNLICFLNEHWSAAKPDRVVKEAMLPLQAFRNIGNAEHTVRMTSGLHAVAEAMCVRFGIPVEDIADSTVRRHFIGRGRMGTRAESKAAVIQRCHLLGYMPKECRDADRADALALWDLAAATVPSELYLFGEMVA